MVGTGGVGKSALTLQFMYEEVRSHPRLQMSCIIEVLVPKKTVAGFRGRI